MKPQFLGSITADQLDRLDHTFATLTPTGWVIPPWLVWLRTQLKDSQ